MISSTSCLLDITRVLYLQAMNIPIHIWEMAIFAYRNVPLPRQLGCNRKSWYDLFIVLVSRITHTTFNLHLLLCMYIFWPVKDLLNNMWWMPRKGKFSYIFTFIVQYACTDRNCSRRYHVIHGMHILQKSRFFCLRPLAGWTLTNVFCKLLHNVFC